MPSTATLYTRVSNELLPRVRQPAQYIGGELNQLAKPGDWTAAEVKIVIAFPDTYTIGMSHLGCQILYWLCNHTPGVCAERVFCPWIDAEAVMRSRKIPLFTWDTRQPVADADILAISLQYEMCFTNVLNLLDLAGIPLRAADRTDDHPLVLAGGPQADNPEPMAEFLDLVVIGDGEHSMAEITEAYREYKRSGVRRREMIVLMARRFPWIYAPNLYDVTYHEDGTMAGIWPKVEGIPTHIDRCQTPDFEDVPFPTRPIVPWLEVVHDRIGIEVMRGCPQRCRFCHAGYTKRPLGLRSVDRILEIAEEAYWATGHDEIGLLSLSTADYPDLRELAEKINERFASRMVNIALPSLRVDKMLQNIPWMAKSVRKSGLTIAVEAANDDMRAAIRKKVTDGNLLDGVLEAYKAGWQRVKLYYMCGFPGERDSDVRGIVDLSTAVSEERKKVARTAAEVTASVGWLVPKPYTPFQWMAQPRVDYFLDVRERIRRYAYESRNGISSKSAPRVVSGGEGGYASSSELTSEAGLQEQTSEPREAPGAPSLQTPNSKLQTSRGRDKRSRVRIVTHSPERSILEAVFARGDRRLSAVVYEAWVRGARHDGWDECFKNRLWLDAYHAVGINPDFYAHRERPYTELLPWDHIGSGPRRGYLEEQYDDVFTQIGGSKPLPVIAR